MVKKTFNWANGKICSAHKSGVYYISECGRKKVLTNTGSLCHLPQEGGYGGKIRRYSGWGGRIKNREKSLKEGGMQIFKNIEQISPYFCHKYSPAHSTTTAESGFTGQGSQPTSQTSLGFHPLWYVYKRLWPLDVLCPTTTLHVEFREHHCIINWMCLP